MIKFKPFNELSEEDLIELDDFINSSIRYPNNIGIDSKGTPYIYVMDVMRINSYLSKLDSSEIDRIIILCCQRCQQKKDIKELEELFEGLTEEQSTRFTLYLNSLPSPKDEESIKQYQKALERLKLEDPELYSIFLRMRNKSAKAIRNER